MSDWRIAPGLLSLSVPIGAIYKDPENFNVHPEENLLEIERSLKKFGQVKPIVVNQSGMIVAGNGTYDGAVKLGAATIAVVRIDGDYLSAEELKLFGISDNATAKSSYFDEKSLNDFVRKSLDDNPFLEVPGFTDSELSSMAAAALALVGDGTDSDISSGEGDKIIEKNEVPHAVKLGQIWKLGPHRLICGDSTKSSVLSRLMGQRLAAMMWSDPPYGMSYQSGMKKEQFSKINNDNVYLDCSAQFPFIKANGAAYVCTRWDHYPYWFDHVASQSGYKVHNCIIWHKPGGGMGNLESAFIFNHEFIIYASNGKHLLNGKRSADVWNVTKDAGTEYMHPTQKPVALAQEAISYSSKIGDLVLLPFSGSGSDLLACHASGRVAMACELDPQYCDVIIYRYEATTGLKAILLEEDENETSGLFTGN